METTVCANSIDGIKKRKRPYDIIRFIKISVRRMKPGPAEKIVM